MTPVDEKKIARDLERQKTTAKLQGAGVNVGKMPKFLRNTIADKLPNLLNERQDGREEESETEDEEEESEDEETEDEETEESIQESEPASPEFQRGEPFARTLAAQKAKDLLKVGGEEEASFQDEGQVTGKLKQGAQMGTAKALSACWKVIYYVLPLFYIDFHGIMRYVFKSEYFCRYGEEWQGGGAGSGLKAGASATAATANKNKAAMGKDMAGNGGAGAGLTKKIGGALELLEIWVVVLCNLIVLFAIFICLVYIYYITHPQEALKLGLTEIGDLFKGLFK